MISASHNPYHDNGIKFFGRDGFKLADQVEAEMERYVLEDHRSHLRPTKGKIGRIKRVEDASGRYMAFIKQAFPDEMDMNGFKIVIDCANGATYKVAPTIMAELGADVHAIGIQPNGRNINLGCGSLHPEKLCASVRSRRANLGIALDGDGDRLVVSDEKGEVVDGDQIMAISALHLLKTKRLPKKCIVATIMSNLGLDKALADAGGKVIRAPVGDRYVVEELRRSGCRFGGEQSGHLIYLDFTTTGDGIVAALRLIEVMMRTQKPLSELKHVMEIFPQKLINVKIREKRPIEEIPSVARVIESMQKEFGKNGRAVVRYSGTEPLARVLVEGPHAGRVDHWAEEIAAALKNEVGT
jgi:phosphoglucosamine mutase